MWIWNKTENLEGFEIYFTTITQYGAKFILDLEKHNLFFKEIGLLPKYGNWQDKEAFDRIFKHEGQKTIYIFEGDPKVYTSLQEIEKSTKIISAYYDEELIRIIFNRKIEPKVLNNFFILELEGNNKNQIYPLTDKKQKNVVYFSSPKLDMEKIRKGNYIISSSYGETLIKFGKSIYKIYPPSEKLGEDFTDEKILFRVFSTAKDLFLILKNTTIQEELEIPFTYKGNFIWEVSISTKYYGYLYKYKVIYPDKVLYGIEPYATLTVDNNNWAMIYKDNFKVSPSPSFDISETIIYEMNIRDFTINENSGVKNKGKYIALSEVNSYHPKYKNIKTGILHLKELGINAVHIMPFYDFEKDENSNSYDWGYMPVSFNSPDGWFAVNKLDKIKETKIMIDSFHKNGIKVIMDVVYNHTSETKEKIYNFNAVAYDYYYRKKEDGSYYNGSGCGNEFMSESPFGRRFIIDSLKYWVNEFGIDGFRFDLMGLIDLETVDEIIKELKKIKSDIIIYGEPWHAGGTPIKGVSKGSQKNKGFAVFNDDLRDALKGSVFNIKDLGYVQAANYRDRVIEGIKGSINNFTASPLETINYVSCHDNHTLYDKIRLSMPNDDEKTALKRIKLSQAITALSQGIYFLHSGEEFIRTKKGNENSYNAGDEINNIEWSNKKIYYDLFLFHKNLIKIKKEHPAFKMKTSKEVIDYIRFFEDISINLPNPKTIAYLILGEKLNDDWGDIIVLINPLSEKVTFNLPNGKWLLRFDTDNINFKKILYTEKIEVSPISLVILSKKIGG
ncbi:MAG: type I pullulanase, partial [Elusimicrobiales bacterium]|nr:type I pullulanase [Elusimicrobiales bacterium]